MLEVKNEVIVKGIVLAGGTGSRLHPLTHVISKQLLPVYNKPMIYYPISVLFSAGIRDILIICTPDDAPLFKRLLGEGSRWGVHFSYAIQPDPQGIAQAFIIAEEFLQDSSVCLILGDNIFYGDHLGDLIATACQKVKGASLFGYHVKDPERYGVVSFDSSGRVTGIEEKPKIPQSSIAVTGLYIYDNHVIEIAKGLRPSARGELEITDINNHYLKQNKAHIDILGRGYAWLDTGTFDSLLQASEFVQVLEERQGRLIASLEEIALLKGWIGTDQVLAIADQYGKNDYGKALKRMVAEFISQELAHAGA